MRARHGTHQVETLPAAIGHVLDVLGPCEVTVEDDSVYPISLCTYIRHGSRLKLLTYP